MEAHHLFAQSFKGRSVAGQSCNLLPALFILGSRPNPRRSHVIIAFCSGRSEELLAHIFDFRRFDPGLSRSCFASLLLLPPTHGSISGSHVVLREMRWCWQQPSRVHRDLSSVSVANCRSLQRPQSQGCECFPTRAEQGGPVARIVVPSAKSCPNTERFVSNPSRFS